MRLWFCVHGGLAHALNEQVWVHQRVGHLLQQAPALQEPGGDGDPGQVLPWHQGPHQVTHHAGVLQLVRVVRAAQRLGRVCLTGCQELLSCQLHGLQAVSLCVAGAGQGRRHATAAAGVSCSHGGIVDRRRLGKRAGTSQAAVRRRVWAGTCCGVDTAGMNCTALLACCSARGGLKGGGGHSLTQLPSPKPCPRASTHATGKKQANNTSSRSQAMLCWCGKRVHPGPITGAAAEFHLRFWESPAT